MSKVDDVAVFFKPHQKLIVKGAFSLSSSNTKNAKICENVQGLTHLPGICLLLCSMQLLILTKFAEVQYHLSVTHTNIAQLTDITHVETYFLFRLLLNRHTIHQMMVCEVIIIIFEISNKKGNNYTW